MFVMKNPGAIALTVIPYAASSSASVCMRCRAPAFAVMYAAPITGSTLVAASDVVTTIRPNPLGRMCRTAARAVAKIPLRLMSMTRFQRSSV